MKLSKEECIAAFKITENAAIQGKDAALVAGILDKLDKEIVKYLKAEQRGT